VVNLQIGCENRCLFVPLELSAVGLWEVLIHGFLAQPGTIN
jgi:hypothetical protein